ncbi:MAG: hypothetical protein C5B53_04475 [Candidatus Melainabacteria bacterium]|nr:MAG: hypothetical protein C5B53_04475 [Candidatus Melainabacteria bacterium]
MTALMTAVTVGIFLLFTVFFINFVKLAGGNVEQKSAIEAAALAGANDLSRIVIDTPEFGYVSLSDQAPIGANTGASDQYPLPVHGINTIIGTARLDAIIADQLGDSLMWNLAMTDLANARKVITTELTPALQSALQPSPTTPDPPAPAPPYKDRDGNVVNAYADAESAYKSNPQRMTNASSYVEGSLKLTLGELSIPINTNIPVPQPAATYPVPDNQQQNGFYLAFVDIPYKDAHFVFGAIGGSSGSQESGNVAAGTTRLVDVRNWVASAPGLPYHVPTLLKAEADEFKSSSQSPITSSATFHSAACAEPASVYDPRPSPGALAVEFPDGQPAELTQPQDLLTDSQLNNNGHHVTVQTSSPGDFPTDPGSQIVSPGPWPFTGPPFNQPNIGDCWRCTLYDWIRRGGTKARIDQVLSMQTTPFTQANPPTIDWKSQLVTGGPIVDITTMTGGPQIPFGMMNIYKFDANGNVTIKGIPESPYPYEVMSENQLYGESINHFNSSIPELTFPHVTLPTLNGNQNITADIKISNKFDVYVRDQVRLPGKTLGGKHGGEPLDNALTAVVPIVNDSPTAMAGDSGIGFGGDHGRGGTGAMPGGSGTGAPPLLTTQDDFAETSIPPPPYVTYSTGPGAVRPTYQTTGITGSIRFRREIPVNGPLATLFGQILLTNVGYFGDKTGMPGITTYANSDSVDVTDMQGDK